MTTAQSTTRDPDQTEPATGAILGGDRLRVDLGALVPSPLRRVERWHVLLVVVLGLAVAVAVALLRQSEADPVPPARDAGVSAVERLVSFDSGRVAAELDQEAELLTDDFAASYVPEARQRLAGASRQARVSVEARVVDVGVESARVDEVVLVMSLEVSSAARGTETAESQRLVRVTMRREGGRWLVAELTTV